jgi:hypothetical protein
MDGTLAIASVRLKPDTTYAFLSGAERRVYYRGGPPAARSAAGNTATSQRL